jgi:hypothetical protein
LKNISFWQKKNYEANYLASKLGKSHFFCNNSYTDLMLLFLQKIRKFIQHKLSNNFEKCFTALNLKILSSRMLDVSMNEEHVGLLNSPRRCKQIMVILEASFFPYAVSYFMK